MNIKNEIKKVCEFLSFEKTKTYDVLFLFEKFEKNNEKYATEIMLCACVLVTVNLYDEELNLRDIINVVYFVKNRAKIIAKGETDEFSRKLINDDYDNSTIIHTMTKFTISNYYIIKKDVSDAEQSLLKIIDYDFKKSNSVYFVICQLINYSEIIFSSFDLDFVIKFSLDILEKIIFDPEFSVEDLVTNCFYYVFGVLEIVGEYAREKSPENAAFTFSEDIHDYASRKGVNDDKYVECIKNIINIMTK